MSVNAATTRPMVSQAYQLKIVFPRLETFVLMISPIDLPSLSKEAASEPKAGTPPTNTEPMTIQRYTGIHPNAAARIGPVIGPAPAIDEKWCPKRTRASVGT